MAQQNNHKHTYDSYRFLVKGCFGSRRNQIPEEKITNLPEKESPGEDQTQFLWKVNFFFNLVGIGAGVFVPKQALLFILASNSIFQVYESSRVIKELKQFSERKSISSMEEKQVQVELKGLLKKSTYQLNLVVINTGVIVAFSVGTGLGVIYPGWSEYALIGLNFWTLYNLKFNGLSHGYYVVLLSLLGFQFLYFFKVSSPKKDVKIN